MLTTLFLLTGAMIHGTLGISVTVNERTHIQLNETTKSIEVISGEKPLLVTTTEELIVIEDIEYSVQYVCVYY